MRRNGEVRMVRVSLYIEERQLLWLKKKQKFSPSGILRDVINRLMEEEERKR